MIRNNKNMLFYKTPKKSKLMIINNFLPNYLGRIKKVVNA